MNLNYIQAHEWKIVEEGFNKENVTASESIFSIGNGAMGQRANFEEQYSGETFQGSYIGGIYYPDKTRVGWWKNGYPEYFAKVLNAPNWIGIGVSINGKTLDLNTCKVIDFSRELDMRNGVLTRSFIAEFEDGDMAKIHVTRFLSMDIQEVGAIKYSVTPINFQGEIGGTVEFNYCEVNGRYYVDGVDEPLYNMIDKKQPELKDVEKLPMMNPQDKIR